MAIRFVSREEEPVNFRPVPGLEQEWATFEDPRRSLLWLSLGILPVSLAISMLLVFGAMVLWYVSG